MDFDESKLNLTWNCKWIICKRITEHTCWSVGVRLTHHINFASATIAHLNKYWHGWACVNVIACHSLTGLAKKFHVPLGDTGPPKRKALIKFQKSSAPGKCVTSKFSSPPNFRGFILCLLTYKKLHKLIWFSFKLESILIILASLMNL